jgi:pyridoxamine 5'-phosphate oxidase
VLKTIKDRDVPAHLLLMPGAGPKVPRPENWGGYRIHATRVELWAAHKARLHDRAVWNRAEGAAEWERTRLFP